MKEYHDLLTHIRDNGVDRGDRTGTGTRSVFGHQMRFNLADGFPVLTTKKLHLKSIIHELLWFLKGDTNTKYLEDNGVRIWNEWKRPFNALGPVYGHMMRYAPSFQSGKAVQIKIREDDFRNYREEIPELKPAIECDLNSSELWAIDKEGGKNTIYTVQFKSGGITKISRPNWRSIKNAAAVDPYAKTVAGVGYSGKPKWNNERLYNMWRNMIVRCYDQSNPNYHNYGGRGVIVSPIWHSYEKFQETISSVPFFHLWQENAEPVDIDKDYFGSDVYSPSTCIFLPKNVNVSMPSNAIRVKDKIYASWGHYEQETGNRTDYIREQLRINKPTKHAEIHEIEEIQPEEGYVWRRQIFVDQIEELIDQLKKNPESRRHLVSCWIPSEIDSMALPPCHCLFQFYVAKNKLSCQLYQRSADVFLGVPFNIASYALLTMMIAQVCDLELGDFVHTFGDVHIYHNHFEQVETQLKRTPKPLPTMKINPEVESIFDFKFEDFELIGYDPDPSIKAPVAV